ncbi:uncharacterized protein [Musca autumnalis]|uniref:uncharacterized protein n=1 Tax=Musca autumnalis TaxID=221902 RepID=UPI003CEFA54E
MADTKMTELPIDDLFKLLEMNFNSYREVSNLKATLPLIHSSLCHNGQEDHRNYDIDQLLYNFYECHKETEQDLMIVVQIIHQVLYTLNICHHNESTVPRTALKVLAKQLSTIADRKLVANIVACIHLYTKLCKNNSEIIQLILKDLLECLKTTSVKRKIHVDILMQLFDDFCGIRTDLYNDAVIVATTQSLLKSNQREDRKCGYYLLKKTINVLLVISQKENKIIPTNLERSWIAYVTILENLEENQSHLILPSLDNLNDLVNSKVIHSSWLDILFVTILSHKNSLVVRWSIEYFLNTFTCSEISCEVLKQLLEACNSNMLYNYEGYFLNREYFLKFLQGDLTKLYELMGEINWKSVPLDNLLTILMKNTTAPAEDAISYEQMLNIAARVRALQDYYIRQSTLSVVNRHFERIVENMTMKEYVNYIVTLCNPTDKYDLLQQFYKKLPTLDCTNANSLFKGRFYEILLANIGSIHYVEFVEFLKQLPISMHGWLKYLPFHFQFHREDILQEFFKLYSLNIEDYMELHLPVFDTNDKNEYDQHLLSAIAFYVEHLKSFDDVDEEKLKIIFNHKLTDRIILKICCLLDHTNKTLDHWIITNLLEQIATFKDNPPEFAVHRYLERNKCCSEYLDVLLDKRPYLLIKCQENLFNHERFKLWNYGCDDIKKGDSRIEEVYRVKIFGRPTYTMRDLWLYRLKAFSDENDLEHLVAQHKIISKKKSRYFANSHEHRLKMRIALGFANVTKKCSSISDSLLDELWSILLYENNQLNISYFYEYIVGTREKRKDVFLKKLEEAHSLTSSQQVSILSVLFIFCKRRKNILNGADKNEIISNLMALTMGANFHTRLFAQLILFRLLNDEGFQGITFGSELLHSIEVATRGTLEEHSYDLRLHLHTFDEPCLLWDAILYVTNAPYDEIIQDMEYYNLPAETLDNLQRCKNSFSKKLVRTTEDNLQTETCNQVQRKMNPSNDVLEPSSLMIYPTKQTHCQMFVIASLIDKLPNLGGIARTCEVLGIQNLIMDTKKDIEKSDFKNLSMTAEKSLNIMEVKVKDLRDFIIEKQREGFAVVGAEQTSNSENFVNFKFPEKCILLLGHEKDGIPPTLLGLLDHAVEIPQFGQVRSLNVHVTGALFMWEYCKQHVVPMV